MKKLFALLLPTIVLSACYFPPYNEELSLGIRAARDLEERAVVGPVDVDYYDFQRRTVRFYPSKDALISGNEFLRGFIAAYDDFSARLVYINHDLVPDTDYYISYDTVEPVNNNDAKEFSFAMETIEDGSDVDARELFGLAVLNPRDELARAYVMYDGSIASMVGSPIPLKSTIEGFGLSDALVLGVSYYPLAGTNDLVAIFALDRSSGLYTEVTYNTNVTSGLSLPSVLRQDMDLPGLPDMSTCFYYHDSLSAANQASYVSVYDPVRREYRNFSWDNTLQLRVLYKLDRRIDRVLSTGWLYCQDGNTGYVYDSDGDLINSFLLGGLYMVYEIWDGAQYKVVFTIPEWAPEPDGGNDSRDRLYALVYWIPTEELADL